MGKNIGKNISKTLRSEYGKKMFDHDKQSATDALKTALKIAIQNTAEAISDLIGNKIDDKITRVSKNSPKRYSEANEAYIRRDKTISTELRQKGIDDLRLKEEN